MSTQHEVQGDGLEMSGTGIPLTVSRPPHLKMGGFVVLLVAIVFVNVYLMQRNNPSEIHSVTETFSPESLNPITQEDGRNLSSVSSVSSPTEADHQAHLEQKLEEAKARDFIERLQAVQSVDMGGSASGQMAVSNTSHDNSGNQSTAAALSSDPNTAFLQSASNARPERSFAERFSPQPWLIGQGKFIFGTLDVAINSDLPGPLRATVSQDVYGEQGRHVLIPRGSRLVGEYRSGLAINQNRLFVVWTRVILPTGVSVMIGSGGTDALGQSGLSGTVNYHFFARFGTSTLISLIGAGASTVGVHSDDRNNSVAAYREAVTQSMAQQSSGLLGQTAMIPPTIKMNQGEKIVVFVNRDLDFSRVSR